MEISLNLVVLNTLKNGGGEMRSSCQQVQHVGYPFTVPVVSGIIYPDLSETWYILGWKLDSILNFFSVLKCFCLNLR